MLRIYNLKTQIQNFLAKRFTDDGAGWLFLQQLIIAPMSLITTVVLARILSISDYGYYKYILNMNAIIAIFGLTGIYSIASLNIQRGQDNFFDLAFQYRKITRYIPSIISLFVSLYYFYNQNNFLAALFFISAFFIFFADAYLMYTAGLSGKGDFKRLAILEIINYFISYFPPILAAYIFKTDVNVVTIVVLTTFFCQFIFRYFAYHYVRTYFGFKNNLTQPSAQLMALEKKLENVNFIRDKNFEKESLALSVNNSLGGLGNNAAGVVVFNRLGAEDKAVYSLALTFSDFASLFITAPMGRIILCLSKMTKDNFSNRKKINYIKLQFKKYFLPTLLLTLLTMLALPLVYKFLFPKYFFSYQYAVVYSLSILAVIFSPAVSYFYENRHFKLLNILQIIALIINLLLLFIVTNYFGLWGAIIASVFIKFITNLIFVGMMYVRK